MDRPSLAPYLVTANFCIQQSHKKVSLSIHSVAHSKIRSLIYVVGLPVNQKRIRSINIIILQIQWFFTQLPYSNNHVQQDLEQRGLKNRGFWRYTVLNLARNCADLTKNLADTLISYLVKMALSYTVSLQIHCSVSMKKQCTSRPYLEMSSNYRLKCQYVQLIGLCVVQL